MKPARSRPVRARQPVVRGPFRLRSPFEERGSMQKKPGFMVVVAAGVALTLPGAALAQWTAKAEAGVVAARGNTETDTANAKFDVAHEFVRWKHSVGFTGVYASDSTGTTGQ